MPTGYTADVQSGEITEFKDFALRCSRAFGALMTLRDEPSDTPVPEKIEPHTAYLDDQIATANATLASLAAMTPSEISIANEADFVGRMLAWKKREDERRACRLRYETMLDKVRKWQPPTADHFGLKKFMEEQLVESIKFDCGDAWGDEPIAMTDAEWHAAEVHDATRDLRYATDGLARETNSAATSTQWLIDLRGSL